MYYLNHIKAKLYAYNVRCVLMVLYNAVTIYIIPAAAGGKVCGALPGRIGDQSPPGLEAPPTSRRDFFAFRCVICYILHQIIHTVYMLAAKQRESTNQHF